MNNIYNIYDSNNMNNIIVSLSNINWNINNIDNIINISSFKNTGPCGSGIKYKRCCKAKVDRCKHIMYTINYNQNDVVIDEILGFEEPIQLPNYKTEEISKLFRR